MSQKTKTQAAIDKGIEVRQGTGFRRHLGASVVGNDCARQIWYIFRWARRSQFGARLLRLFDRGNREEERVIKWLRQCGIHTLDRDPDTGKQFRVSDHNGHFGGSMDAMLYDAPDFPNVWTLGEIKTHNNKSFTGLKKHGLKKEKPVYWVQAQIYMHYTNIPQCLHFNINKDNDDMETFIVEYDAAVAERYIERGARIIETDYPPKRISESPGWYQCKWCDYQKVCHYHEPKEKNCRTCVHSRPVELGQWLCTKYDYTLNEREQRVGCLSHQEIPE